MKKVLVFGELLWDCLPEGAVLGGAPANFALRLTELGVPCLLLSKVGQDELGKLALSELALRSINTVSIQQDSRYPTGTVKVVIDKNGIATYFIAPHVAYDYIDLSDEIILQVRDADALYFGSLATRSEHNRITLENIIKSCGPECIKILDINLRKDCWTPNVLEFLLHEANILKLNLEEAKILWELWFNSTRFNLNEFPIKIINKFSLGTVIVTRGEHGVFACDNNGNVVDLPGIPVETVDTIGAGDAFTAGFLASTLQGNSLEEACTKGNQLGAKVAMTRGGMTKLA